MTAVWSSEVGPVDAAFVALIHGSMDRSSGMLKLSRVLDATCRVARYDRRGYGSSRPHDSPHDSPHDGPFDMAHQVADLAGVLGGRPAVLVGHSYGGNVALAIAAAHPDLVRGVVVYETPLSWEPWWPGTTAGADAVAAQGDPAGAAEQFMRRMIGDERWDGLPERTRVTRRLEGAAMVAELADLRLHRPWNAADISVPVIAGFGSLGSPLHREGTRYLVEQFTARVEARVQARVVELPGCRHDAPLSHPKLFAQMLVAPMVELLSPGRPAAR